MNNHLEFVIEQEKRAIFVDTTELFCQNNQMKTNMYEETKQEDLSGEGLKNIAEKWKNIIENSEGIFQRKIKKQPL